MAKTLLESYKGRLALTEKLYAQSNPGKSLSAQKKLELATLFNNTTKKFNESLATAVNQVQFQDMGNFKRFCLDITTLTQPSTL